MLSEWTGRVERESEGAQGKTNGARKATVLLGTVIRLGNARTRKSLKC